MNGSKNYYTDKQLAEELNVGIRTVQGFRKYYGLEGIKIGREWAYSVKEIDRFFRDNAGKSVSLSNK